MDNWTAVAIALLGSPIIAGIIDFVRERRKGKQDERTGLPDQWKKFAEQQNKAIEDERRRREEDVDELRRESERREADLLLRISHLQEKLQQSEKRHVDLTYKFEKMTSENARLQSENQQWKNRVRKLEQILIKHGLDTGPLDGALDTGD